MVKALPAQHFYVLQNSKSGIHIFETFEIVNKFGLRLLFFFLHLKPNKYFIIFCGSFFNCIWLLHQNIAVKLLCFRCVHVCMPVLLSDFVTWTSWTRYGACWCFGGDYNLHFFSSNTTRLCTLWLSHLLNGLFLYPEW